MNGYHYKEKVKEKQEKLNPMLWLKGIAGLLFRRVGLLRGLLGLWTLVGGGIGTCSLIVASAQLEIKLSTRTE